MAKKAAKKSTSGRKKRRRSSSGKKKSGSGTVFVRALPGTISGYCVSKKAKNRTMKDIKLHKMKSNGRYMLFGTCTTCGGKMTKIPSAADKTKLGL